MRADTTHYEQERNTKTVSIYDNIRNEGQLSFRNDYSAVSISANTASAAFNTIYWVLSDCAAELAQYEVTVQHGTDIEDKSGALIKTSFIESSSSSLHQNLISYYNV